jgi:hypothetical protein
VQKWLDEWLAFLRLQPSKKQIQQLRGTHKVDLSRAFKDAVHPLKPATRDEWLKLITTGEAKTDLLTQAFQASSTRQLGAVSVEMQTLRTTATRTKGIELEADDPIVLAIDACLTAVGPHRPAPEAFDVRAAALLEASAKVDFACYALSLLDKDDFQHDADELLEVLEGIAETPVPSDSSAFKAGREVARFVAQTHSDALVATHGKCQRAYDLVDAVVAAMDKLLVDTSESEQAVEHMAHTHALDTVRTQVGRCTKVLGEIATVVQVNPGVFQAKLAGPMARWNAMLYAAASNQSFVAVEARACQKTCLDAMRKVSSSTTTASFVDCATAFVHMLASLKALALLPPPIPTT